MALAIASVGSGECVMRPVPYSSAVRWKERVSSPRRAAGKQRRKTAERATSVDGSQQRPGQGHSLPAKRAHKLHVELKRATVKSWDLPAGGYFWPWWWCFDALAALSRVSSSSAQRPGRRSDAPANKNI